MDLAGPAFGSRTLFDAIACEAPVGLGASSAWDWQPPDALPACPGPLTFTHQPEPVPTGDKVWVKDVGWLHIYSDGTARQGDIILVRRGVDWVPQDPRMILLPPEPDYSPGTELVLSTFFDPYDWYFCIRDIWRDPKDPWNYVGLVPLLSSRLLKGLRRVPLLAGPAVPQRRGPKASAQPSPGDKPRGSGCCGWRTLDDSHRTDAVFFR